MKDVLPNLGSVLQAILKSLNSINCLSSKKKKSFGSSGCGRTQKLKFSGAKFSGVVARWVLRCDFCMLVSLLRGVCVSPFFLFLF